MAVFENYPYTNLHNLNLDYILKNVQKNANDIKYITDNIGTAAESAEAAEAAARYAWEAAESITQPLRRVVCIGDSYAEGYSPDGNNDGWPLYLKSLMKIADDNFESLYYGGIGFCNTHDNINFITLLGNSTITDKTTVTDLIVAGGRNDVTFSTNDIISAINTFATTARVIFPNARIWVCCCARTFESANLARSLIKVESAYSLGATNSNLLYMSNVRYCLIYNRLSSDRKHPNAAGNTAIAWQMKQILEGGNAYTNVTNTGNLSPNDGTIQNGVYCAQTINSRTTIAMYIEKYTPTTPISSYVANGFNNLTLATIPQSSNFIQESESCGGINVTTVVFDSTGYQTCNGNLMIIGNAVTLQLFDTTDAHDNFRTFTNIRNIQFGGNRLFFESLA